MDTIEVLQTINKLTTSPTNLNDQTKSEVLKLLDIIKEDCKKTGKRVSLYSKYMGPSIESICFYSDQVNNNQRSRYHIGVIDVVFLFDILEKYHEMIDRFFFHIRDLRFFCNQDGYEDFVKKIVDKYENIKFGIYGAGSGNYCEDMDIFRSMRVYFVFDYSKVDSYFEDGVRFLMMDISITEEIDEEQIEIFLKEIREEKERAKDNTDY
ncbi:MAG: hypothetical protein JXR48_03430 [Candidatus Delongbacteria bacterium]|nr:hypothetical protein [Candidatus Delongbacteria bacterium]MBN2833999.1 hypothetical protein [Candidatus Delongbacteria bacterium]